MDASLSQQEMSKCFMIILSFTKAKGGVALWLSYLILRLRERKTISDIHVAMEEGSFIYQLTYAFLPWTPSLAMVNTLTPQRTGPERFYGMIDGDRLGPKVYGTMLAAKHHELWPQGRDAPPLLLMDHQLRDVDFEVVNLSELLGIV